MQLCAAVSSRGAVRQRKAKVKEAAHSSGFIILQQFLCRRCLVQLKGQVSPFPSSSYMMPGCARPLCRSRHPLCCLAMMPPTWSHTMCRNHVRRNPPGRGGELWLAPLPAPPWQHWGSAQPLHSLTELHGSANPLPTSCTHLGKICQKVTAQTNKTKQHKKDFICNLPPCHIRVFLLAALHIPALALTSRSDVSPAARATKNSRAERAAPTACSSQTSWLRQPHQGFDPAPCPGSRANHPLLKRQP